MKIVLLATPRSGSTSMLVKLKEDNRINNMYWEIFNINVKDGYARQLINIPEEDRREFVADTFVGDKSAIAKILSGQLGHVWPRPSKIAYDTHASNIIESADKIYYCFRRDTAQQIYSLATALMTQEWGRERHVNKMVKVSPKIFKRAKEEIVRNYLQLIEVYKKYPGEILCCEDFLEYEPYPYQVKSPYKYNGPNIEDLFMEQRLKWKPS